MEEEWRPIKNYEGLYEVSNLGRIKSLRDNHGIFMLTDINSYIEEKIIKSHITRYVKTIDNELDAFEKIII